MPDRPAHYTAIVQILIDLNAGNITETNAQEYLMRYFMQRGDRDVYHKTARALNNNARAQNPGMPPEDYPFPDVKLFLDTGDRADIGEDIGTNIVTGEPGPFTVGEPEEEDGISLSSFLPLSETEIARRGESKTTEGRRNLFSSYLSSLPGSRLASNLLTRAAGSQFAPLSAQFALQAPFAGTQDGFGFQNFRTFLQQMGGVAPLSRLNQEGFQEALAPLSSAFMSARRGNELTDQEDLLLKAFQGEGNQALQDNIMSAYTSQGVAPFLQGFVPGLIGRRRESLYEKDPNASLFANFLESLSPAVGAPQ